MDLSLLAKKAKKYNSQIKLHQAIAVKASEPVIVKLNRKQMLRSKLSNDKPMVHAKTGSNLLSKAYGKRTGKKRPNLFVDGTFQGEMFLETNENDGTYFLYSFWAKTKYLVISYTEKIFGIPKKDKKTAINKASKEMYNRYRKLVWRN